MNSVDLSKYYTDYYTNFVDIKELVSTENALFDELVRAVDEVVIDQYILTAEDRGLKYYEEMFNIIVNPDEDSIEFRRQRVLNRFYNHVPFTEKLLRLKLDSLLSKEGYELNIDADEYTLTVTLKLGLKNLWSEVEKTLISILPSNILLIIALKYNTYEILNNKTHAQLSAYTHFGLREDELA